MADLITAELMDILIDKYLFTNIPPNFSDFDNGTLINIFLRMITVFDDAYDISRSDCPFDPTQESTQESRQYFLKHIIRCIRPLECSYWAPKASSLLDKKRAMRILVSLYEEGSKKYGKGLPQRIRMVIKREEMRNKNLFKKNSKVNGTVVTMANGRETDVEMTSAAEFFKVNSDCVNMGPTFTPVKSTISTIIIPEGRQIPRTPLKLDPFDANIKDEELMPPPEFCSPPPTCVELPASCLSPPTEFSDAEGTCLQALPILSPPEEFKNVSKGIINVETCSPRSHFSISPKSIYTNSPSTPPNGENIGIIVPTANITSNNSNIKLSPENAHISHQRFNQKTVIEDEKLAFHHKKDFHQVVSDELLFLKAQISLDLQLNIKENENEIDTINKKISPMKIHKKIDYEEMETMHRLSDVAPLRFMDDEDNLPVTYFNAEALKGRETYDIVPKPLKSRETFVVSQLPKSRETFVVSHPLKSRETFVVSQPLKSKINSIFDKETENDQHHERVQSVVNQLNELTEDKKNLSQSLDSDCNQSQIYQEVEDNSFVTVKQEDGKETFIKKTVISPDLVSTTVTEINYAKNKAVRHFPKGNELLRTPPSNDSSLCCKSYNLDSSLKLNKNDLLVQIYMTKKDANNLQTKKTCSSDNKSHESVLESKRLVNYSIKSNSSAESNSFAFDSDVGNNQFKMEEHHKMDVEEVHGNSTSFERNCQNIDIHASVSVVTKEICLKEKKIGMVDAKISASDGNLEISPNTFVNSDCDRETLQLSNTSLLDDDSLSIFPSEKSRSTEVEYKNSGKSKVIDSKGLKFEQQNDTPISESLDRETLLKESLKLVRDIAKIQEESEEDSKSSKQMEQVDVNKQTRARRKVGIDSKENNIKNKSNELTNRKLKNTKNKQVSPLKKTTELIEYANQDVDSLKSARIFTDVKESKSNVRECRPNAQKKNLKTKEEGNKKTHVISDNIELRENLPATECKDKISCSSEEKIVCIAPEAVTLVKSHNYKRKPITNENLCEVLTDRKLTTDESSKTNQSESENKPNSNDTKTRITAKKDQQLKCDIEELTKNVSKLDEIRTSRRNKTKSFKTANLKLTGNKPQKSKLDKNEPGVNDDEIIQNEKLKKPTSFTNLKTRKSTLSKQPQNLSRCVSDYLSEKIPNLFKKKGQNHNSFKPSKSKKDIENEIGDGQNESDKCTTTEILKVHEEENSQVVGEKEEVTNFEKNANTNDKKLKGSKKVTNLEKVVSKEVPMESKCDEDNIRSKTEVKRHNSSKTTKREKKKDNEKKQVKGKNGSNECVITDAEKENVKNSKQCLQVVGEKEEVIGKEVGKKDEIPKFSKKANSGKLKTKDAPTKSKCDKDDVVNEINEKKLTKAKSSKTKITYLKTDLATDNMENIKIKQSQKFKNKKVQNSDENSSEKCRPVHVSEKLEGLRSPLQVINARPSRRCKTKASEAISKAMNDSSF